MSETKLYAVRKGYVFKKGREMVQAGSQREMTLEEIAGQTWKLEEIKKKPGPKPKVKETESKATKDVKKSTKTKEM